MVALRPSDRAELAADLVSVRARASRLRSRLAEPRLNVSARLKYRGELTTCDDQIGRLLGQLGKEPTT